MRELQQTITRNTNGQSTSEREIRHENYNVAVSAAMIQSVAKIPFLSRRQVLTTRRYGKNEMNKCLSGKTTANRKNEHNCL